MARRAKKPAVQRKTRAKRGVKRAPEWLAHTVRGEMRAILSGREMLAVENCAQVLMFTQHEIRLQVKKGEICVRGAELDMRFERKDMAVIRGRIDAVLLGDGADG